MFDNKLLGIIILGVVIGIITEAIIRRIYRETNIGR